MLNVRRNAYRPIELLTLLGVHIQGDPLAFVPNSEEAERARHRLVEDDLIKANAPPQLSMPGNAPAVSYQPYKTTPRGVVWLEHILETPLPVQSWHVPAHGGGFSDPN